MNYSALEAQFPGKWPEKISQAKIFLIATILLSMSVCEKDFNAGL